ncbi:MAG: NADH:ubiquinone reductase (Na(+)-transporting) subunit F, partial [Gammaproteobacteria bacterium]|nr:NADH:ubiquinone reductase (Na(+)-transporting) subunit F [Gammaproteobacteria bacterium]
MNVIEVVLGVSMFTGIIMMLVFVILYARRLLVSTGEVTIEINGDPEKTITCSA